MKKTLKIIIKLFCSFYSIVLIHASKREILYYPKWIFRFKKLSRTSAYSRKRGFPYRLFYDFYKNKIAQLLIEKKDIVLKTYFDFFDASSENEKFFLYKIYHLLGLIDQSIMKLFVDFAQATNNFAYKYWTFLDLTFIAFERQDCIYPSFYSDRRLLLKNVAESFSLETTKTNSQKSGICIISYQLNGSMQNSMQRVASLVANGLLEFCADRQISVITTDCFSLPPDSKNVLPTLFSKPDSICYENTILKAFDKRIRVFLPCSMSIEDRANWVLKTIISINPEVIIDITDETSPLSYYYSRLYPTVYLPLRMGGSSSYYSRILGSTTHYKFIESVENEKVIDFCLPEYVPPIGPKYSRAQFGFSDNSFIIANIGAGVGFDNDFINQIVALLQKHNNFVWVLIGFSAPNFMKSKFKKLFRDRRIIEHGYEKNLISFFEICDICVRTNTTGGSGATAFAAMTKTPVVMTNYICDCMRWLGYDYSLNNNYQELFDEIEKLYLNKEYYNFKSNKVFQMVSSVIDYKASWKRLADILEKEVC